VEETIKVLVTGAGSFIARCLIQRLVALGFSVRGFDVSPVDDPVIDVEYLSGDITRAGLLSDMVRGVDHIFHLLKVSPGSASGRTGSISSALAMTIKLMTLAENLGVSTFVYLSGSEVYGRPREGFIEEGERRRPLTPAGKEHLTVENHLIGAAAEHELSVAILRCPPVIGWGTPRSLFPSLYFSLRNALTGRPVYVIGKGRYLVQYIDVEDLASAMARVILVKDERRLILNVAADDVVSQGEICDFIFRSYESASSVYHLPDAATTLVGLLRRTGIHPIGTDNNILFYPQPIIDTTRGKGLLSLTPKRTLESLEETFEYWIGNRSAIDNRVGDTPTGKNRGFPSLLPERRSR
jgi:nucleoside-diphosphate-sugar epimerase